MTILLLIRHGSNDFVKEGRLAGWLPEVHLNAQGQREADALARRLNHISLSAIYSSPLDRCMETATAVALCQKLPIHVREELGEFRSGDWQGKKIDELKETETWKQLQSSPSGVRLPNGETIDEVQTRMVAMIDAIVKQHPNEVVAVFSHADPLKAAIAHYLKMNLNDFQHIIINPASVTVFFFGENGANLFKLNDTDKLPSFKPESPDKKKEERKEESKMPDTNILYELNPVTHITVGTVGKPGNRTFYLQGRQGAKIVTLVSEKQQISALAEGIDKMLERLGTGSQAQTVQVDATEMELSEPIDPVFRIGQLGLGYDAQVGLLIVVAYELPEEENPASVNAVRFWATPDQMRALARHASGLVAAGRPICVLCGRPIDPDGHFCPKRNGHGAKATLD